jgi:hypothetical protein
MTVRGIRALPWFQKRGWAKSKAETLKTESSFGLAPRLGWEQNGINAKAQRAKALP